MNDGGLTRGAQTGAQASIETLAIDPATPLFRVRSFSLLFITRGGFAIIGTVGLWTRLFPALRRVDRPDEPQPYKQGGTTRRG